MAKAIITLDDHGTDEVQVKFTFEPELQEGSSAHALAAHMLRAASAAHEGEEDDE